MDSFDELGVGAELSEALAAEGIERPTPLQEAAIPLLRKGNNAVLAAGPGSGVLVAWAGALLDRLPPEGTTASLLVLTSTREAADRLAESVAALAATTGHTVAAIGSSWVLPERAQILLGTPTDIAAAAAASKADLASVQAVVVDQAQLIDTFGSLSDVERVLDYVPPEAQRVVSVLPMTSAVGDLIERHFKRAVTIPSPPSGDIRSRGEVRFRIAPEPREAAVLSVVDEVLSGGARHVLVFSRTEDDAADIGDYLTLHGFTAGAPGDTAVPVWLGVDALEARAHAKGVDDLVVVSSDAPADPDTLDRRHSISEGGVVVVLPRELAHLKSLGKRTGYGTVPFPPPASVSGPVDELRATIERALETEDIDPYLLALEPLFERHDPAEIAAAAVALLRKRGPSAASTPAAAPRAQQPEVGSTPAWAKLFVGVGERDGLRAGDLLGAITGETGVSGDSVGRIDIKESHSLVEVHDAVAKQVIRAINGTTIKGRAVRADFDRPRRGGAPPRGRPRS